jgi:3-oxoacyl-[acyl-carrier protein] reductase
MYYGINNRTALVIGASKGIGKEICIQLAKEGCKVIAIARSETLLKNLINDLNLINKKPNFYYAFDLLSQNILDFINNLKKNHEEISIIINNIGGSLVSRDYLSNSYEWLNALKFNAGIAIDVNSVFLPGFISKKDGRICHISSISAEMLRGNPLYASAKAYLNAYVKTVGRQVAKDGVILNAVMPGAVIFEGSYWDETSRKNPEKVIDFLTHHQAINRFGTPNEIASLVLFLVSDKASFMQGSIVPVDGGNM